MWNNIDEIEAFTKELNACKASGPVDNSNEINKKLEENENNSKRFTTLKKELTEFKKESNSLQNEIDKLKEEIKVIENTASTIEESKKYIEKFSLNVEESKFSKFKTDLLEAMENFDNKPDINTLEKDKKTFDDNYINDNIVIKLEKNITGLTDKNVSFELVYHNIDNFDHKRVIRLKKDAPFDYQDYFNRSKKFSTDNSKYAPNDIDIQEQINKLIDNGYKLIDNGYKVINLLEFLFSIIAFRKSINELSNIEQIKAYLDDFKKHNNEIQLKIIETLQTKYGLNFLKSKN